MATHEQVREDERANVLSYLREKRRELEKMPGMKEGTFGFGTINGFNLAILEIELMPEVEEE